MTPFVHFLIQNSHYYSKLLNFEWLFYSQEVSESFTATYQEIDRKLESFVYKTF